MKRSTMIALVALLVSATVPALAADPNQEKVICDLASKNCVSRVQTLEKKIKKLNMEIKKGDRKYSPEELKKLEMKLQEAQDQLDRVESTAK
ncbi:hypothetical protein LPW11_15000 [Geomonas sp. RF6]|uniref:hypothetical protein n=1 Tax=Geomonas sp. RF6 TaxID=2897342 RepID=UPI001E3D097F|nr:hypothetical protein [Geomonas sp. RF6]UFS69200.1 hypothetical protein LPW11_15000 [Geomonas sp. RF6]